MENKITSFQYATITFFLLNSFLTNITYHTITIINNNDSIISILLGGLMILLFSMVVNRIHTYSSMNIFFKSNNFFIKIILSAFYILIASITAIYSIQILANFIHYYVLKEVDFFIIVTTLVFTILYITSKGIKTICKVSEIFFFFYLFIIIFARFGVISYADLSNLKPLLSSNIIDTMRSSLYYFSSCFIPFFFLLSIDKSKINKSKYHKTFTTSFILLSTIFILIQLILIISVLGINLTNIYIHPDMIIYRKISFLNILDRVEVLLSFGNILNSLFLILISTNSIKKCLNNLIGNKKELLSLVLLGIIFVFIISTITLSIKVYFIISLISLITLSILFVSTFIDKYMKN